MKNFPYDDLFEERAIILGKLGKHEKVLAIYIQILGDVDKAAAYCEEIYQKDHHNVNIYVTLIRTLLVPPTIPPYTGVALHPRCLQPNVDSVLQLLKEHATKFNPHAVLQVMIFQCPSDLLINDFDSQNLLDSRSYPTRFQFYICVHS